MWLSLRNSAGMSHRLMIIWNAIKSQIKVVRKKIEENRRSRALIVKGDIWKIICVGQIEKARLWPILVKVGMSVCRRRRGRRGSAACLWGEGIKQSNPKTAQTPVQAATFLPNHAKPPYKTPTQNKISNTWIMFARIPALKRSANDQIQKSLPIN